MREIELKFQVPMPARAALAQAMRDLGGTRTHLQAAYFDTPERDLARAGMALRVRKEGPRWVQTLKGLGSNAMERLEDNQPRKATRGHTPEVDVHCHAGSAVGQRLLQLLAAPGTGALQQVYRTDIQRTHAQLQTRRGRVEMALDVGRIVAGSRHLDVHELEFELIEGSPWAVLAAARPWVRTHGLWLDLRSKAQMGERLARADAVVQPTKATAAVLPRKARAWTARQQSMQSGLSQILAIASDIAGEQGSAEHVHQLRVAIRRLRTTEAFARPWAAQMDASLLDSLSGVFRALGDVRDHAVLTALWREASEAPGAPVLPEPESRPMVDAAALLRAPETNLLWLDLLALAHDAPPTREQRLKALARDRLKRWQDDLTALSLADAPLSQEARHRLRKRVKRLRYALETMEHLLDRRRLKSALGLLAEVQQALGAERDLRMAQASFAPVAEREPQGWFPMGWWSARQLQAQSESERAIKLIKTLPRLWKA